MSEAIKGHGLSRVGRGAKVLGHQLGVEFGLREGLETEGVVARLLDPADRWLNCKLAERKRKEAERNRKKKSGLDRLEEVVNKGLRFGSRATVRGRRSWMVTEKLYGTVGRFEASSWDDALSKAEKLMDSGGYSDTKYFVVLLKEGVPRSGNIDLSKWEEDSESIFYYGRDYGED